jgi:hypothetical protein
MNTAALLDMHAAGTLTEDAYDIPEAVLASRSIHLPGRPGNLDTDHKKINPVKHHCVKWAKYFFIIGIVIPIICLALDFRPAGLIRLCDLCWPTGFILMVMGTHFEIPVVLISVAFNALIWAGFGWSIGYGTSGRIRQ